MLLFDIFKISKFKEQINALQKSNETLSEKLHTLGADDYYAVLEKTTQLQKSYDDKLHSFNNISNEVSELLEKHQKLEKQISSNQKKLNRMKDLYKCSENALNNFSNLQFGYEDCKIPQSEYDEMELLAPSIMLKLHCMDMKDLRKAYRENEKQISLLLSQYSSRYTTKANKTIYNQTVIA